MLNQVLAVAAQRGLRDLTVAASSIFPVHAPLVEHIESGVVGRIVTSFLSRPVAHAVSAARLSRTVIMQTHGGRAAAIETGRLPIDIAFVAAPTADEAGNTSGAAGRAACGPLGYAIVDTPPPGSTLRRTASSSPSTQSVTRTASYRARPR